MVKDPISCLDVIAPYSDWVFFHYEAVSDPVRVFQKLNKHETMKGITYNLCTESNLTLMETGLVDATMFMGISPGVLGTKSWPDIVAEKIYDLRTNENGDMPIFVDGSVSFKSIKKLVSSQTYDWRTCDGADFVVCGGSTLFKIDDETELMDREEMIKFNIERIKAALK